jgi:hypothetical protein
MNGPRTVLLPRNQGLASIFSMARAAWFLRYRTLARWNEALMSERLLTSESLRELWTEGRLPSGKPIGYAMGFVPATLGSHR